MWYKCIITILHWYFISVIYYTVLKNYIQCRK
ncbi:hypothetical protein [Magpiepox virus 2]|nr:hypothetical protein [Magpiepox virus 2]